MKVAEGAMFARRDKIAAVAMVLRQGSAGMCLAALWVGIAGCSHGVAAPKGGADVPPSQQKLARRVMVAPVERRDLTYTVETVGTLEAEHQTSIAAGVTGIVD